MRCEQALFDAGMRRLGLERLGEVLYRRRRMSANGKPSKFGVHLKHWRRVRGFSQLHLSVNAGVSARHLSFIETGRAQPSREMVLLLASQLQVPLREQNAMLLAAGFAPTFLQRDLNEPELDAARDAVRLVLANHDPFPAIAVDRKWDVLMSNCGAAALAEGVAPELLAPTMNVYRISLHPDGMRNRVVNFADYARHLLGRLRHDAAVSGDAALHALLREVEEYPGIKSMPGAITSRGEVALPLRLRTAGGELSFITMIATFGTPFDVTVSELAIESFFPADEATARQMRART
jgi:transcriptional regulator with XRE-family HTH domain